MKSYSLYPLDHLPAGEFGQKAHRLALLAEWGYPICAGVALPAGWLDDFCQYNSLPAGRRDPDAIMAGDFPDGMARALRSAWETLSPDGEELIVRSSAGDEDAFDRSYAGVYESVAHVGDVQQLLQAVKRVWASSRGPSATDYAADRKEANAAMGVVIQVMMRCERSGVLFTRDPLRDERRMLIEASAAEEGVTSGAGDCQRYWVERDSGQIHREEEGSRPMLGQGEITSLYLLAKKVEASFGFPCDLEWGMRQGRVKLFQVRPLRLLDEADAYHRSEKGIDCILLDRYAQPACACYLSMLEEWQNRVKLHLCSEKGEEKPLCFMHNRVYWNVRYQREQYDAPVADRAQKERLDRLIRRGYRRWYRRIPRYEAQVRRGEKQLLQNPGREGLLGLLHEATVNFCDFFGGDHYLFLGIAQVLYRQLQKACAPTGLWERADRWVGRYSSRNETLQANRELLKLAGRIKKIPPLLDLVMNAPPQEVARQMQAGEAPAMAGMLRDFLRRHGHRSVSCDDLSQPHWAEAPERVIALLAQLIRGDTAAGESRAPMSRERAALARALKQEGLTKRQAGRLLTLTGEYIRLRENQRYYFDKSWVLLRKILLGIGDAFTKEGRLSRPEDIFHLTIREVRLCAEYPRQPIPKELLAERRRLFEMESTSTPPYVVKDSVEVEVQKGAGASSYKAMGISPGTARGKIRPIWSVEDLSRVAPGEIGVVRSFHPSWTPVLRVVSGLIMNYGNLLSHGAVVAREYGVPVVVFNGEAMDVLEPGDEVELNGLTGRVRILRRAAQAQ